MTVGDPVVLHITTDAEGGIKEFSCDIISPVLTPSELKFAGLSDHLDLVNPGEFEVALNDLGLPVNVGGNSSVDFNITDFMGMIVAVSQGEKHVHEFKLTVTDKNGTTVKSLKIFI